MTASTSVDTRIGLVGVEATDDGIRRVRLPEAASWSAAAAAPRPTVPRRQRLNSRSSRAANGRSSS